MRWDPDLLDGYVSTEIELPDAARLPDEPEDVEVVATLVRRDEPPRSRRAACAAASFSMLRTADAVIELCAVNSAEPAPPVTRFA